MLENFEKNAKDAQKFSSKIESNILIDLKEIKNKIASKNNLYCLLVILIIFFLDRYTKIYIMNNFSDNSFILMILSILIWSGIPG